MYVRMRMQCLAVSDSRRMPHRGNNRSWEGEVLQDWDLARETEGEDEREEEVEYKSKDKKH